MEAALRRLLGMYFLVIALQYVPTALYMLGVENPVGPQWILLVVPLLQGLVTGIAGLWLLRTPGAGGATILTPVLPRVEAFIRLLGLYFSVNGLVALARPLSALLLFNEVWSVGVGGMVASAAVATSIGVWLFVRPDVAGAFFTEHRPA